VSRYTDYYKPRRDRRCYWIDKYKMAKGCDECGYNSHPAALQFAHIDRMTKIGYVKEMVSHKIKRLVAEMRKCRVLCANCHAVETNVGRHYERKNISGSGGTCGA